MSTQVIEPRIAPTYLTLEGYNKLQQELDYLRQVKRKEFAERLYEAYEGDAFDEVSEPIYDWVRNEQAFCEGRIIDLEQMLSNPIIIDGFPGGNVIEIGATVTIQEDGGMPEVYKIVGSGEASPREGRISFQSPLGSALMGRCPGDVVTVKSPDGDFYIRVLKLEYINAHGNEDKIHFRYRSGFKAA
jgi:transcription elongation factor GreA